MRDIARRAGVSSATVSRVINGSSLVTQETTKRVQSILDQTGFIPSPHATTLKYGRSKMYGIVIPDICNPFYGEFLGAFEHLLGEIDHEVLFTNVENDAKLLASVRRMLMRRVDGAVLMASEFDTKAIEPLLLNNIPLVTVDRCTVQQGCSDVAVDYASGFSEAVAHLKELGHRQIGYIGGTEGLRTSQTRLDAFRVALQSNGLKYKADFTRVGNYRVDGGAHAIKSLWQKRLKPSAVMTANDLTAFGVMRGLHDMGLRVPDDLSLIGVDDVVLADITQPGLTTIRLPLQTMAMSCLKALEFAKDNILEPGIMLTVSTCLVVRASTAQAIPGRR